MFILAILACSEEPVPVVTPPPARVQRLEATTSAVAVPDCDLLIGCPQPDVDPASCLDDPTLFSVTMIGDVVSSVDLDPEALVPTGAWVAPFPDPSGGCDLTLFSFRGEG